MYQMRFSQYSNAVTKQRKKHLLGSFEKFADQLIFKIVLGYLFPQMDKYEICHGTYFRGF